MYCSNCGTTLTANLNYCNSCGTRVENKIVVVKGGSPVLGIGAAFVGGVGLMALFPILRELLRSQLAPPAVVIILVFYLLTVLAMFGALLFSSRRSSSETRLGSGLPTNDFVPPASFRGVTTAQLEEHREPVMSVTDHTTKTLDHLPLKRN